MQVEETQTSSSDQNQSDCPPCPTADIVLEQNGKRVTIDLTPLEWIILGISASAIAAVANMMVI